MKTDHIVGKSVPRKEGRDKVTGRSQYVDDMVLPNMIFGATVRSQIPRGRIRTITFGPGIAWDEFVIVSAKDIPGKNCISLIGDDQPCLASEFVNHSEEPILLLAHPDRHLLPKAVQTVSVEYDPLPGIFTIEESERRSEIVSNRSRPAAQHVPDAWIGTLGVVGRVRVIHGHDIGQHRRPDVVVIVGGDADELRALDQEGRMPDIADADLIGGERG